MINVRSYKKAIREMKAGETFYYNSISGTLAMIDYTRELIQSGIIAPVQSEIEKSVVPSAVADFMSGKSIFPQMTYIKLK